MSASELEILDRAEDAEHGAQRWKRCAHEWQRVEHCGVRRPRPCRARAVVAAAREWMQRDA